MTREEALSKAINIVRYFEANFAKSKEARDEAVNIIKALEQEPSEDCIARQPLIDKWNCCADMLMDEGDAEVVMGWIFDAPSVIPQPKTGHWIRRIDKNKLKCSECDVIHLIAQYPLAKIDWCPNCGAKMESEDK